MGGMDVAVKQLQPGASEEEKVKFLQEAAINGQFRHPNVVKLMGVVTTGEPVSVIKTLQLLLHDVTQFSYAKFIYRDIPVQLQVNRNTNNIIMYTHNHSYVHVCIIITIMTCYFR